MQTRSVMCVLAWGVAVVAAVGVGLIPGDLTGESLCGVWGCFPPVQALASLHLLWLLVLAPPAVALARRWPGRVAGSLGAFVLLFGLLLTACLVAMGLTRSFYAASDPEYPRYAIRRAGYILATRTDVPAVQLMLIGVFAMMGARRQPDRNEGDSDAAVAADAIGTSGADSSVTAPRTLPSNGA